MKNFAAGAGRPASYLTCPVAGLVALSLALSGCVTASLEVNEREEHWRQVVADEAPAGAPRDHVLAMFDRHGLEPTQGTYVTVRDDGSEYSNCRLPRAALMAYEYAAVRGLYLSWDVEVTVCFDEDDRVEDHFVGARNAGI